MQRLIDIGGRKLDTKQTGHGRPTVVIEVGSTQAGTQDLGWRPLCDALAAETSIFLYDRAGLGASDPVALPRPISAFTADLRAVLQGAGVQPPYLLVGCSFGGLIVAHYAAHYPQEVAGILLLDSPHPETIPRTLAILPSETSEESTSLKEFRQVHWQELYAPLSAKAETEGLDLPATIQEMRAAWDLGAIPLIVLTAGRDEWEADFPQDVAARYAALWLELQQAWTARSSHSHHQVVQESGHCIHDDAPAVVLDAIRGLLRSGGCCA
jgi:pimeloyl-ACP methyl ester carboxylesterase